MKNVKMKLENRIYSVQELRKNYLKLKGSDEDKITYGDNIGNLNLFHLKKIKSEYSKHRFIYYFYVKITWIIMGKRDLNIILNGLLPDGISGCLFLFGLFGVD